MTITGNRFIACGSSEAPVIHIAPENKDADRDAPVHRNIRIENNTFEIMDAPLLSAKSTQGLKFRHNSVVVMAAEKSMDKPSSLEEAIRLTACSGADVSGNSFRMEEQ
ncbi:Alpha-1,3-galactosidase A [compost metagenome]